MDEYESPRKRSANDNNKSPGPIHDYEQYMYGGSVGRDRIEENSPNATIEELDEDDEQILDLVDTENISQEKVEAEREIANEVLAGALMGDFNSDPTFWSDVGQIVTGLIPVAGQLGDIRDLVHILDDITNFEGYKKIGSWATLVLIVIGFVPGIGDAIAKLGKRGLRYLDNNRILKQMGEFLGENIIAPILNRVGDLTAPLVDQIKNAIRRKLEEAQQIARQLGEGVDNVIDDVTGKGQPRLATEGAGNVTSNQIDNTNQPLRSQGNSSGGGKTPNNITRKQQQALDSLGKDTVAKIKSHLTPQEITEFVDELGVAKVKELADKFGGDVMKHYGHAFFKSYQGVTQDTMNHLLKNDGIVKGVIKGCHDKATFLGELNGKGQIVNQTTMSGNSDVIKYSYKLYQKDKTLQIIQPPTLSIGKAKNKTVIDGLASNQSLWQSIGNQAVETAIMSKKLALDGGQFKEIVNGITIVGYLRNGKVDTFFPSF